MRLLFIHRYRSLAMHRKAVLLAEQHGFIVRTIFPRVWRDEYGSVEQHTDWARGIDGLEAAPTAFLGRTSDPHRATYRTLDFGMRRFRPDVILAEEEPDSIAALHVAAARAVFAPQARLALYTWQNQARPLGRMVRLVQAAALRAADAVLCANSEAVSLLRRFGFAGPCPVIPANGVDVGLFHPLGPLTTQAHFGYVGRMAVEKGLEDAIAAVESLADLGATLTLIGDGPHRAALQQFVAQRGAQARVRFVDPLRGEALVAALATLRALVLPSQTTRTWKEQFGRVLTEAMACGVPVIGSDSGAIPEVIDDAGLTFPEGDVDALAARMRRIACDDALAAQLRDRGLQRVHEHYTQERIAAATAAALLCVHQERRS